MAVVRKNTKTLFEEAKKLLTDSYACYKLMTSSLHLTLPPRSLGNARRGILDQLDSQLGLFSERLSGMLVAYDHVRIQQSFGSILTSQPDGHFDIIAEFIIFQPAPGSVLKAVVTKTGRDSVGCLVHGCFNASFYIQHQDEGGAKQEYQTGKEVIIEVFKIFTTRDGLISMRAKLANPQLPPVRGQKRSHPDMESADSGFANSSFAAPVSSPPHKKHRSEADSGPSATSTPFPSSQFGMKDNNFVDESFIQNVNSSNKKKKKDKREKDLNASIPSSVSSDDVDAAVLRMEGSGGKKKKKKDKDPDKSRIVDNSNDVFRVSMSEGSTFSSSGLENITDTEKKRRKEKRKSETKMKLLEGVDASYISLEMSDCSSSNLTIDSGLTHISTSSLKKKKHKKSSKDS